MDVFNKFIIEDGALILAKVTFHNQLTDNISNVKSGGAFEYTLHEGKQRGFKTIIFFGSSDEFGAASLEDINKAIFDKKVYWTQYSDEDISEGVEFYYKFGNGKLKRIGMVDLVCEVCGKEFKGIEPNMCCNGADCGCAGLPTEPVVCSKECWDKYCAIN